MSDIYVSAEVGSDPVDGGFLVVRLGDVRVTVYIRDESAVVETGSGSYGLCVGGPWWKFKEHLENSRG